MKILQFRGEYPNFGDELNSWLWPKLIPDFFDDHADIHFIGIGSTIGDAPRDGSQKIIFGAGFVPDYHEKPDVHDGNWKIYFVRGPRTAKRLNLDPDLAIGDAGILLRTQVDLARKTNEYVAFMPHWESMARGNWQKVCARAGVVLIDPRQPVDAVISQLLRAKLVIAEAMHGAIIADAFRIPFVPMLPLNHVHRDKWYDWAESLGIMLAPIKLRPSSLTELSKAGAAIPKHDAGEAVAASPGMLSNIKRCVMASPLAPVVDAMLVWRAAQQLRQLAYVTGSMSSDAAMEHATQKMIDKLAELRRDYGR